MSITTERRVTAPRTDVGQSTTTHRGDTRRRRPAVRTQTALDRRRHVHATTPQGRVARADGACLGDTGVEAEPERISWAATVVGIIATAAVLLAFVAVANLRAESIDTSQQSASSTAVAQYDVSGASVTEGRAPLAPAVLGQ